MASGVTFGPYPATVIYVHDGDTFRPDLDLGFGIHSVGFNCRIYGINAPELTTQAGKDARDFAKTLLPEGEALTILAMSWDKYGGRFDGKVTLPDGRDFGQVMVDEGYAVFV